MDVVNNPRNQFYGTGLCTYRSNNLRNAKSILIRPLWKRHHTPSLNQKGLKMQYSTLFLLTGYATTHLLKLVVHDMVPLGKFLELVPKI